MMVEKLWTIYQEKAFLCIIERKFMITNLEGERV